MRTVRRLLIALVCAAAACDGSSDALPDLLVEVRDSAGVQLVHNREARVDTQAVRLVETMRIGAVDGPEEFQFHLIRGVAVDALGRYFVADGGSNSVRVYDADGAFVRQFGGQGEGPGEFTRISGMFLRNDTVHASSGGDFRGSLFDTTGVLLKTYTSLLTNGSALSFLAAGPEGWIVGDDSLFARRGESERGVQAGDSVRNVAFIALMDPRDIDGTTGSREGADSLLKRIMVLPGRRIFYELGSEGGSERFLLGNPPFFEPGPSRTYDGRGWIYVARGWPYTIDVHDARGNLARQISRANDSIPVTDEMVQEVLRRAKAHFDTTSERTGASLYTYEVRSRMPRVGYVPVINAMRASDSGWLWVRRHDLVSDPVALEWSRNAPPRPSLWDVFDPEGRYRQTVQLPPSFSLHAVTENAAIGVLRDELDVQYVVRFEVRG
jgi:hypothetical protein